MTTANRTPALPTGRGKLIEGFDYRTDKKRELTRAQWRDELRKIVEDGGRRRVDAGETFATGRDGVLAFEVYENIPL